MNSSLEFILFAFIMSMIFVLILGVCILCCKSYNICGYEYIS